MPKGKPPVPMSFSVQGKGVAPPARRVRVSGTLEEVLAQRKAALDASSADSLTAREASELLEGGRARLLERQSPCPLIDADLHEIDDGIVLVSVHGQAINDTLPVEQIYLVAEIDGEKLTSWGDEATRCEHCGTLFNNFSTMYAHQGGTCTPPAEPDAPHPVRISFDLSRLPLLQPFLTSQGLQLEFGTAIPVCEAVCGLGGSLCSFVVDRSLLQRRLKEAQFAEASCYNLEQWYFGLQEHTSKSVIVPLSDVDLQTLKQVRAAWHVGSHALDMKTMEAFERLRDRVQEAGWAQHGETTRYFVKTSMRSPKDAYKVDHGPNDPPHRRLLNEIAACAVENASDALELLLKSRRVDVDISNYLRYRCEGTQSWKFNLILRKWDDSILSSIEWRCFVLEGRLTVISQYHCYTALPDVIAACRGAVDVLKDVRSRIAAFHHRVHTSITNSIGTASYVLDVATPLRENAAVRVIEVNPVLSSGAALFSWVRDAQLITQGRSDGSIELRVAHEVLE